MKSTSAERGGLLGSLDPIATWAFPTHDLAILRHQQDSALTPSAQGQRRNPQVQGPGLQDRPAPPTPDARHRPQAVSELWETLTLTSLLKDVINDMDEQPDEET